MCPVFSVSMSPSWLRRDHSSFLLQVALVSWVDGYAKGLALTNGVGAFAPTSSPLGRQGIAGRVKYHNLDSPELSSFID